MPLLKSCVVEPGLCCSAAVLCYIACWSPSSPYGLRNPHSKQSTTGHRVESEGREWNCFSFKFSLVQRGLRAHDELGTIPGGWEKGPSRGENEAHSPLSHSSCVTNLATGLCSSPMLICGNFLLPSPSGYIIPGDRNQLALCTGAFVGVSMMVPCLRMLCWATLSSDSAPCVFFLRPLRDLSAASLRPLRC